MTEADIRSLGDWFYDFELPDGVRTNPDLPEDLRTIHRDRSRMLDAAAALAFPDADPKRPLAGRRAIDVGCHEGFYSHRMIALGAEAVLGIDVRPHNIEKARMVADSMGIESASYQEGNAEDLRDVLSDGHATFDVSLVFGLLYHCENPVRVLRQIASVTDHAIIVETQLCDESHADAIEWGRAGYTLPTQGVFTVVDESRLHPTNRETGVSPLALCPSEGALRTVLAHCGFASFHRVEPHAAANEQLARGKRGVFVAIRTDSSPGNRA